MMYHFSGQNVEKRLQLPFYYPKLSELSNRLMLYVRPKAVVPLSIGHQIYLTAGTQSVGKTKPWVHYKKPAV